MCEIDISENYILELDKRLLNLLLRDHSTKYYADKRSVDGEEVNPDDYRIIWGTHDYMTLGEGYEFNKQIKPELITGKNGTVIMPRVAKSKVRQTERSKQMAEVFTPSWVCNVQNNLIDEAWFGRGNVFNTENEDHTWKVTEKIDFDGTKGWHKYVNERRLEITCGEAPYLTSRYDSTTGKYIPVNERIGLLDRKLRVVSENTETKEEWREWAYNALKNTYGYEWQGDNLLIARENVLFTFIDHFKEKFGDEPKMETLKNAAYIISWNLWQMDGLNYVSPQSKATPEQMEKWRAKEEEIAKKERAEKEANSQMGMMFTFDEPIENEYDKEIEFCVIKDWKSVGKDDAGGKTKGRRGVKNNNRKVKFKDIVTGRDKDGDEDE